MAKNYEGASRKGQNVTPVPVNAGDEAAQNSANGNKDQGNKEPGQAATAEQMQMVLEQLAEMKQQYQELQEQSQKQIESLQKEIDELKTGRQKSRRRIGEIAVSATGYLIGKIGGLFSSKSKEPDESADDADDNGNQKVKTKKSPTLSNTQPLKPLPPLDGGDAGSADESAQGEEEGTDQFETLHNNPLDSTKDGEDDGGEAEGDDGEKKEGFFSRHKKAILGAIGGLALLTGLGSVAANALNSYNANNSQPVESGQLAGGESTAQDDGAEDKGSKEDKAVEQKDATTEAAEQLGVDVETYKHYDQEAQATGLSVERVKELAEHFGVPADQLGTSGAMKYMRDEVQGEYNISEKYSANTPQEFAEALIFTAHNNPAALAQYMAALTEDGETPDSGLDGLEMPVRTQQIYTSYTNRDTFKADFATFVDEMSRATVESRDATGQYMYSYFIADDQIVCSEGPENTYGQTDVIYYFQFDNAAKTKMAVKNGCFQTEAGKDKYVNTVKVVVEKKAVPKADTPVDKTPDQPAPAPGPQTDPDPVPELDAKDPSQDANVNPENPHQTDNAPATEEPQVQVPAEGGHEQTGDNGQANTQPDVGNPEHDIADNNHYVDQSGNAQEVGNTGSQTIPKPTDNNGNIAGSQPGRPAEQDW